MRHPYRKNPKIEISQNGYLINPINNSKIWYHGSSHNRKLTTKSLKPDFENTEHVAFFITSSIEYAEQYAETSYSGELNRYQGLYEVSIKAPINLCSVDLLFTDHRLTDEGNRLLKTLTDQDPYTTEEEFRDGLQSVAQDLDWSHFVDVEYYESSGVLPEYALVNAFLALGYDGWIERRSRGLLTSVVDLAIFHTQISKVEILRNLYFRKV